MHASGPSPEAKLDSLFHKVANYALFAIGAAFVLRFVFAQFWPRLSSDMATLLAFIPELMIISAIPAGIIALCGIPRYGPRKLLWKGLVGALVPILLFVFAVSYGAHLRKRLIEETQKMEQKK